MADMDSIKIFGLQTKIVIDITLQRPPDKVSPCKLFYSSSHVVATPQTNSEMVLHEMMKGKQVTIKGLPMTNWIVTW